METNMVEYNIIIVGDWSVGKSSIINRYTKNEYDKNNTATIGMSFKTKDINIFNTTTRLNIWDTGGSEKFRSLTNNYYRNVDGIFIVYDTTNQKSLFNIDNWMKDIKHYAPDDAVKILVGNKCENQTHNQITIEEGELIARHFGILLFEVSSKNNIFINEMFYTMVSEIYTLKNENPNVSNAAVIRLVDTPSSKKEKPSSKCCSWFD